MKREITMNCFLRQTLPIVVALATTLPALADAKGEAILKEVELRAKKIETYSADMKVIGTKKPETATVAIHLPNKIYFTFTENNKAGKVVVNDGRAYATQDGKRMPMPADAIPAFKTNLWNIVTGNARALVGEYQEAKFVTQKLIDDVTVLDVIDVIGSKATVRLYVNGNSFVERVTSNEKAPARVMDFTFTNLKIDEPIPAERFALPE